MVFARITQNEQEHQHGNDGHHPQHARSVSVGGSAPRSPGAPSTPERTASAARKAAPSGRKGKEAPGAERTTPNTLMASLEWVWPDTPWRTIVTPLCPNTASTMQRQLTFQN